MLSDPLLRAAQPRRRCGSITGTQVLALLTLEVFVVVLLLLGVTVWLAAGTAVLLLGVLLGTIPVPQLLGGDGSSRAVTA